MNCGWIKVHRKIKYHPRYKDHAWFMVWMYLLMNAAYELREAVFEGRPITLKRGQLITGRHAIAKDTGVNESKVKRTLEALLIDRQIDRVVGRRSSLLTILNWDDYQGDGHENDHQIDRQSGQQMATLKEIKKKEESTHISPVRHEKAPEITWEDVANVNISLPKQKRKSDEELKSFFDHFAGEDWIDSRGRKITYRNLALKITQWWSHAGTPRTSGSAPIVKEQTESSRLWAIEKQIEALKGEITKEQRNVERLPGKMVDTVKPESKARIREFRNKIDELQKEIAGVKIKPSAKAPPVKPSVPAEGAATDDSGCAPQVVKTTAPETKLQKNSSAHEGPFLSCATAALAQRDQAAHREPIQVGTIMPGIMEGFLRAQQIRAEMEDLSAANSKLAAALNDRPGSETHSSALETVRQNNRRRRELAAELAALEPQKRA